MIFTVDCHFSTHDDLKLGITSIGFFTCEVLAADGDEACLIAASMVASIPLLWGTDEVKAIPTITTVCL